jgi:hypothetical protein
MSLNRLPRLIKNTPQKTEGTKEDHWRDFWMLETGTGQQVAQLLDCYMMMIVKTGSCFCGLYTNPAVANIFKCTRIF